MSSRQSTPSPTNSPTISRLTPISGTVYPRHRAPRPSFTSNTRPSRPIDRESYLASASESQTEEADAGEDTDSDEGTHGGTDQEFTFHEGTARLDDEHPGGTQHRHADLIYSRDDSPVGGGISNASSASSIRKRQASPTRFLADGGRGEHVLVERRSANASSHSTAWGTALLDSLDSSIPAAKKRANSPTMSTRTSRSTGAGQSKNARIAPRPSDQLVREPTPLLTLDSIHSTNYNPFALFHLRGHLIPEVALLSSALLFASYRLYSMEPTEAIALLPFSLHLPLSLTALSVPLLSLFQLSTHYYRVPFTDERGYRDPAVADDGVAAGIILPILLACACYWDSYMSVNQSRPTETTLASMPTRSLIEVWETSGIQAKHASNSRFDPSTLTTAGTLAKTLLRARYDLVLFTLANSCVLLIHLVLSERVLSVKNLPRGNAKRFLGSVGLGGAISLLVYFSLKAYQYVNTTEPTLSPLEVGVTTFIQQVSLYVVSRLARRGFTLGELNVMTIAGNALGLEFWRLTRSRWYYKRGWPTVPPTFRSPTPIIAFQAVLIPGAFLSGFLLSPLLVISRHIASKPSHRLRWPMERERHRRLLAAGIFLGLLGIIFFMLGGWTAWVLGGGLTQPWIWAISFVLYGGDGVRLRADSATRWQRLRRLGLVAYWAATAAIAVGGWQTRLVRARRIKMRGTAITTTATSDKRKLSTNSERDTAETKVGVESAREERRVYASLNMRRKFFHALAVIMFIPGIAIDPDFTSLAFSVAFALFTFCEYARFFALYPIGGPLHVFFTEFVDSKDSGPVILSHFYLLTGCAGGVWLEGRGINRFTGVLILGIGDALASVVGKLMGRVRWPGASSKTVEGTLAFVGSTICSAWFLRFFGICEHFSLLRYSMAITLTGLLEAHSNQNDNLVTPIYAWSMIALFNV